jgi:plasmid stabilization system protein ParE
MARARRTAAAERDFENIAYQIAVVSGRPATAERILCELQARCDEISARAGFSIEGTAAPQIGDGVRLVSHKRWVISSDTTGATSSFSGSRMAARII